MTGLRVTRSQGIPAFSEDYGEFGMTSAHSKVDKVQSSLLRVLQCIRATD
jgi:hypothetical protein